VGRKAAFLREFVRRQKTYIRIEDPKDHGELTARLRSLLIDPEKDKNCREARVISIPRHASDFSKPSSAVADALEEVFAGIDRRS